MSGKQRQPKGSAFSRFRHKVSNRKEKIKNFFGDNTRTKTQKLKNIGEGYWSSTKKSFVNATQANKKISTLEHGAAGVGKVIFGTPVAAGAAVIGTTTTVLGGITRVAATFDYCCAGRS